MPKQIIVLELDIPLSEEISSVEDWSWDTIINSDSSEQHTPVKVLGWTDRETGELKWLE